MRLELGTFPVTRLAFGSRTGWSGGQLTVDPARLARLVLEDSRIRDVRVDLACGPAAGGRWHGWVGVGIRADALRRLGLHPDQPSARLIGLVPASVVASRGRTLRPPSRRLSQAGNRLIGCSARRIRPPRCARPAAH